LTVDLASTSSGPTRARRWPDLGDFLDYFVLCGFVIAQPLLDVSGRSPDFFLYRKAPATDILVLVALAVLAPAPVLWGLELVSSLLGERARRLTHLALVGALFVVLAVEVGKKVLPPMRGAFVLAIALAAGAAVTALYATRPAVRLWIRFATPAPLVFALLFLAVSPVSRLVLPGQAPARASAAHAPARTPVVMVFFDEFPMASLLDHTGKVDARLYPNFAKLARGSTWYRNATGVSGWTPWAMPAMLTGRYPSKIRAPAYTEYPDNLFTLLGGSYDLKVFETIGLLCPPQLCNGSAGVPSRQRGLRAVLRDTSKVLGQIVSPRKASDEDPTAQFQDVTVREQEGSGGSGGKPLAATFRFNQLKLNQPARFRDFLASMHGSDRPSLYFLHLIMPHAPWRYLPSGVQYRPGNFGRRGPAGQLSTEDWPARLAHQRHLLQLAFTDRLLGQLIERLKAEGLYDKSLLLVTADHGISFTPGQIPRRLYSNNAHELLWVPLFIKKPGQRSGVVDDRNWEHVDLVPTLADLLHVHVPWRMDGISAAGAQIRTRRQKWFYDVPGHRRVVDGPTYWARALQGMTDRIARPQDGLDGLFEVGPDADLVWQRVDHFKVAGGGATAKVDQLTDFRKVDPAGGSLPALVSGRLTAGGSSSAAVAVAVNGVIGGVSQTFHQGETPMEFASVVPDRLFRPGRNTLQLFLVERGSASVTLRPVALTG
jgi:hypothetical protein